MAKRMTGVEEARQAVEGAELANQREEQRLAEAHAEIARLTAKVQETDPENETAFAKLVQTRDTARGRAEALAVRVERSAAALAAACEALAEAQRSELQAQLAAADAELREKDAAVTARAQMFFGTLVGEIKTCHALADRADQLESALGRSPASDYSGGLTRRGSRWAAAPTHKGALKIAMAILPDSAVEP